MFHRFFIGYLISPLRLNFLVQSNPFSEKQLSKIDHKHRRRCSTPLVIRDRQIKATIRGSYTRQACVGPNLKHAVEWEATGTPICGWEEGTSVQTVEKCALKQNHLSGENPRVPQTHVQDLPEHLPDRKNCQHGTQTSCCMQSATQHSNRHQCRSSNPGHHLKTDKKPGLKFTTQQSNLNPGKSNAQWETDQPGSDLGELLACWWLWWQLCSPGVGSWGTSSLTSHSCCCAPLTVSFLLPTDPSRPSGSLVLVLSLSGNPSPLLHSHRLRHEAVESGWGVFREGSSLMPSSPTGELIWCLFYKLF